MISTVRAGLLSGIALVVAAPVPAQAQTLLDLLLGVEQQPRPSVARVAPAPRAQPTPRARQQSQQQVRQPALPPVPITRGPPVMDGGGRPPIAPSSPPIVPYAGGHAPGQIVITTNGRALYYVLPGGRAYRYPIAVGRIGFSWTGTQRVSRVTSWPDWRPPAEMRQREPHLPELMTGGVRNPLGAKAIYLGSTLYRIHGTNNVRSIGTASSSGCFRMTNSHVVHLASLVRPGTAVHVMRALPGSAARRNIASGGAAAGAGRS